MNWPHNKDSDVRCCRARIIVSRVEVESGVTFREHIGTYLLYTHTMILLNVCIQIINEPTFHSDGLETVIEWIQVFAYDLQLEDSAFCCEILLLFVIFFSQIQHYAKSVFL